MTKRRQRRQWPVCWLLLAVLLSTGCTQGGSLGATPPSPAVPAEPTVTLTLFHYVGNDSGPEIEEINRRFMAEYPHIRIVFERLQTDQYEAVLRARLASNDLPDLFGIFAGTKKDPLVAGGYLLDLSQETWVNRLLPNARSVASLDEKVYGLPLGQAAIGVVYNKQIFADLGLAVPTNWEAFLSTCDQLRAAGVVPLALGAKDRWVAQLIPFAMAPSAIYREDATFDQEMNTGRKTFTGSPWQPMMEDYLALARRGCFNADPLETNYDQTVQLVASGEAAMVVNGNWIVSPIKQANPNLTLGMFPLPYTEEGQAAWVSAAVNSMTAIAATTRHPEEAKQYLAFWTRDDIMPIFLRSQGAYPTLADLNADLDPTTAEILQYLKAGSHPFLDQNWPAGVQETMMRETQAVFAGTQTIEGMLQRMDTVYTANTP